MKAVSLSAPAPTAVTPQEVFHLHVYIRVWVDTKNIVRPEELCQWKIPMTLLEIEPATFRLPPLTPNYLCISAYRREKAMEKSQKVMI